MPSGALTVLALALVVSAGCVELVPLESGGGVAPSFPEPPAPSEGSDPRDVGHLRLTWPTSVDPRYQAYDDALRDDPDLAAWVASLDAYLVLPEDLRIVHTECGVENAYYSPDDRAIVLCWELLDQISSVMQDPSLSREETQLGIGSVWLFVMFHETGHALIDALDLPATGREEDAVDDLASLLLIHADAADAAVSAAIFWILTDDGSYSDAKFADEHSLNSQRFYTILCTVYGSDPVGWSAIVDGGYLPHERAQRCPQEYARKEASWSRLLDPYTIQRA
ncbi:MAG TPA: DUF4344 domain-containing metallopeptidase [Candidatus Thermoplasmatota archaeon]|nr:DUF4344 domain-containing metallopeptidase [Candidatus Thermoplasmatota archaeon]